MINYSVDFIGYDTPQFIPSNCNSITFINYGTSIANIESAVLQPNQSLTVDGNACEMTTQNFNLTFTGDGQNYVLVIKKVYI
jgi:hypothetical protein